MKLPDSITSGLIWWVNFYSQVIEVLLLKQSFSSILVSTLEVEDFFNLLVDIFEKKIAFTSLPEENSTLELSMQILYPEVKSK